MMCRILEAILNGVGHDIVYDAISMWRFNLTWWLYLGFFLLGGITAVVCIDFWGVGNEKGRVDAEAARGASRHGRGDAERTKGTSHTGSATGKSPGPGERQWYAGRSLAAISQLFEAGRKDPIAMLEYLNGQGLSGEMEFVVRGWVEVNVNDAVSWLGKNPVDLDTRIAARLMSIAVAKQIVENPPLALGRLYLNDPPNETAVDILFFYELVRSAGWEKADQLVQKEIFQRAWRDTRKNVPAHVFANWRGIAMDEMKYKYGDDAYEEMEIWYQKLLSSKLTSDRMKLHLQHFSRDWRARESDHREDLEN